MLERVKVLVKRFVYFLLVIIPSFNWMYYAEQYYEGWFSPYACAFLGVALCGAVLSLHDLLSIAINRQEIKSGEKKVEETGFAAKSQDIIRYFSNLMKGSAKDE